MIYLAVFIAGVVFSLVAIPLIDDFVTKMEARQNSYISKQNLTIAQNQQKINDLRDDSLNTSVAGYEIPSTEEDDSEECLNIPPYCKRRIGF